MRAQTIEILYERTLAHVIRGKSFSAAEPYLSRIGQRLEELRAAYRAPNVELDYGDPELVDAYLLGYYPHYVHTAAEAFDAIPCDTLRASSAFGLRVLFIGGGPLPELVALVDRMRTCGVGVHLIVIQNCLNEVARTLDVVGHDSLLRGVLAPGGSSGFPILPNILSFAKPSPGTKRCSSGVVWFQFDVLTPGRNRSSRLSIDRRLGFSTASSARYEMETRIPSLDNRRNGCGFRFPFGGVHLLDRRRLHGPFSSSA